MLEQNKNNRLLPQVLSTSLSFLSGVPSTPLRIIHQEGFLAAPCPDGALLLPLFVFWSCGLSADHFLFLGRDKMSGIAMCGRARKREQGGREGEKFNNHNKAEGGWHENDKRREEDEWIHSKKWVCLWRTGMGETEQCGVSRPTLTPPCQEKGVVKWWRWWWFSRQPRSSSLLLTFFFPCPRFKKRASLQESSRISSLFPSLSHMFGSLSFTGSYCDTLQ